MAVNDLIAQGVRPMQIESPLNMMAKMQALREAEQQNQMFQQKQQDYQREQQLQNALRGRLSGGGVNIDNAHELLQYGGPGRQVYESILKGHKDTREADNIKSQIDSRKVTDDEVKAKTLDKHLEIFRAIVPPKQAAASPEGVTALVHSMYAHPVLGPMAAQTGTEEQAVQRNLTLWNKDPVAWEASMSGLNGQGLLDTMKGTRQNNNTGGAIVGQTVDFAGRVVPGSQVSTPTTVSPDARLRSQDAAAARAQSATQHKDNMESVQYQLTDAGLVALPKKTPLGGPITGTPVTSSNGQPLTKPLANVPPVVATKVMANAQNLEKAKTALALVNGIDTKGMKGDTDATGWKGFLPDALLQRYYPQGVDARSVIADLGSMEVHTRSGAAVTASEWPRLAPFIPKDKDSPDTVKKKLARFVQIYEDEQNAFAQMYSKDTGYKDVATPKSGAPRVPGRKDSGVVKPADPNAVDTTNPLLR